MQETGSTVYCPYPGRLGGQCIFIFHDKGSTLLNYFMTRVFCSIVLPARS